jgi:hypothetical protein
MARAERLANPPFRMPGRFCFVGRCDYETIVGLIGDTSTAKSFMARAERLANPPFCRPGCSGIADRLPKFTFCKVSRKVLGRRRAYRDAGFLHQAINGSRGQS